MDITTITKHIILFIVSTIWYGNGKSDEGMTSNCYGLFDRSRWHLSLHNFAPTQVHISYANQSDQMTVVWSHKQLPVTQFVVYSEDSIIGDDNMMLCKKSVGDVAVLPSDLKTMLANRYYFRSILEDVHSGELYIYQVISISTDGTYYTSPVYTFRALNTSVNYTPTFIVYGDMGRDSGSPVLNNLKKRASQHKYSAILHVGDFAYDFVSRSGRTGDEFMNRIEPIAAQIPYMTCPGNHEIEWETFTFYRYKFSMPGSQYPMKKDHLFYSMNIGNVHFISYSSEVYYLREDNIDIQYNWLKQDLASANQERDVRPWIIVFGHRPMYCSNTNKDDCTKPVAKVRAGLEELFYTQGVDLIIEAHEHSYERLWPVYNGTVTSKDYTNPQAPVHVISGAAGCNHYNGICVDPFLEEPGPWSAFRSWFPGLYGFGELSIINASHLHWRQVLAVNEQSEDQFYLVQEHHGPFPHSG